MKTIRLLCFVCLSVLLLGACECSHAQESTTKPQRDHLSLVKDACRDVATSTERFPLGTANRTVAILEESHDSLASQLELAAVLVRLHAAGMKEVVLEGYLKADDNDGPRKPVSREWFRKAAGTLSLEIQRETAARLLEEGEISAAEFLYLAYDDVRLVPGETVKVRGGPYGEKHAKASLEAVSGIAQKVLADAAAKGTVDVEKFNRLATAVQGAIGDDAKALTARRLMEYIVTLDPWLKSAYGKLTNPDLAATTALRDQATLFDDLISEAEKRNVKISAELLRESAEFFRQREKANHSLVQSAIASKPRLVVLNVGSAHTGKVVELLKEKGYGVVVVTPLSAKQSKGRLSHEQFEAKLDLRSVFSSGPIAELLSKSSEKKKPEPAITEKWCQAKGELYLILSRLTRGILGSASIPGGGKPPFGYAPNDFRGSFFDVDPHRITYDPKEKSILIPLSLKGEAEPVVWVKSVYSDHQTMPPAVLTNSGKQLAAGEDADRLVAQLIAHRDDVLRRGQPPGPGKSTPAAKMAGVGIMQIDVKSIVAIGTDKKAVATASMKDV